MFFIVGEHATATRLAICATERQATDYIGKLPAHEHGVYYVDEVRAEDGPVVLAAPALDK